ncbi:hypothetical protein BU14_0087s0048 [Porphyra umbilicalis]|uniref:Uncharacterized protein n=1 Tax=Porphyra umbilicalis TaxID=2786 RepID=A0A1X6PE13_PORUM|nr:hypothetical protein BU14_0087s0048 [Porphyra umbilicalis]|eukprot:OSX79101.1 hypothetical protein BU14_0087s0048 [Porphyra umbilicalis]
MRTMRSWRRRTSAPPRGGRGRGCLGGWGALAVDREGDVMGGFGRAGVCEVGGGALRLGGQRVGGAGFGCSREAGWREASWAWPFPRCVACLASPCGVCGRPQPRGLVRAEPLSAALGRRRPRWRGHREGRATEAGRRRRCPAVLASSLSVGLRGAVDSHAYGDVCRCLPRTRSIWFPSVVVHLLCWKSCSRPWRFPVAAPRPWPSVGSASVRFTVPPPPPTTCRVDLCA